jgi:autotransporter-associated beta strand protein/T5SS/PEP-CTERM-associated repeat protein
MRDINGRIGSLGILAALSILPLTTHAQDRTWTAATGGWLVSGNWSGNVVPTAGQTFQINNSGTAQIAPGVSAAATSGILGNLANNTGALWVFSGGHLTLSNDLVIGNSGTGRLIMEGNLQNTIASIGVNAGSRGVVTMNSGQWTNTSQLWIGNEGMGEIAMSGGHLLSDWTRIGRVASGAGVVNLNSGTFETITTLSIGENGQGTINIGASGQLKSGYAFIGEYETGNGIVNVNGGQWDVVGSLFVGGQGRGELNVNNGTVNVSGTTSLAYFSLVGSGTVRLSGNGSEQGVLQTDQVEAGLGAAKIVFDGGKLKAQKDRTDFIKGFDSDGVVLAEGGGIIDTNGHTISINTAFSGSGNLEKTGQGKLKLGTASTHSGTTFVTAGEVIVTDVGAGDSVFGTSEVWVEQWGTLSGNGTIKNLLRVSGTLSPGEVFGEIGTLTLNDRLALNHSSVVRIDLESSTSFDTIHLTSRGILFSGELYVSLVGDFRPQVGDSFKIFETTPESGYTLRFDSITMSDGYIGVFNYETMSVVVTAVPEPTSAVLVMLGLGLLARRRRAAARQ